MLYVVGTPIGNLNDLSFRQAKTLAEAEIILTEDTRSTGLLLQRVKELFNFEINSSQKLVSYYKEKEFEKLPQIIEWLRDDEKEIALVSEAGMPGISDPGYLLIKHVIKRQLPYTVIPGPTAVTTALLHSGFDSQQFMFLGFLPKKENDIKKIFTKLLEIKKIMPEVTFVAFDSPNRVNDTMRLIDMISPEWNICIVREMTKKFEEVLRGTASELIEKEIRGEVTLVIS